MADIDLNEFIGPLVAPSTQVPSRDRAPAADRMELWRQTTDGIWFSWRTDGGGWTSEASAPPELTDEDPADRLWMRLPDGRWEAIASEPVDPPRDAGG